MNFFTLDIVIGSLTIDNFLIISGSIILGLIIMGIILLVRNVRPILGFLLLVFAIALIIGISYDKKGIQKSIKNMSAKVRGEEIDDEIDIESLLNNENESETEENTTTEADTSEVVN